jgi:hypothetical protein
MLTPTLERKSQTLVFIRFDTNLIGDTGMYPPFRVSSSSAHGNSTPNAAQSS